MGKYLRTVIALVCLTAIGSAASGRQTAGSQLDDATALCLDDYKEGAYDEAVSSCEFAADKGSVEAHCTLGLMYLEGKGVRKNDWMATSYFLDAAKSGHAKAELTMGRLYETGQGVEKDLNQAMRWYEAASAAGEEEAAERLKALGGRGGGSVNRVSTEASAT